MHSKRKKKWVLILSLLVFTLQTLQQPQGSDCKHGDGGDCKTHRLHKTLSLQVIQKGMYLFSEAL